MLIPSYTFLLSLNSTDDILFKPLCCTQGGDLDQFIKRRRGRYLTEVEILELFVQIALAIKHTHDRKILHRDLKPGVRRKSKEVMSSMYFKLSPSYSNLICN